MGDVAASRGQRAGASRRRLLATLAGGHRATLTGIAALLVASAVVPLVGPQLIRQLIDRASNGDSARAITLIAAAFLVVSLGGHLLVAAVEYTAGRVLWTTSNELRADLARQVLSFDMSFHERRTSGELIDRVDGDVGVFTSFATGFVTQVLRSMLTLAGVLVVLLVEDWRIGLGVAVYVALSALGMIRLGDVAVPRAGERRAATARLLGEVEERLHGIDDLRANGGGEHALATYRTSLAELLNASKRASMATRTMYGATSAIFAAGSVLSLVVGVMLYQAGSISLGTVYVLFRYTGLVRDPLEQIADQQQSAQDGLAAFARIEALRAQRSPVHDGGRTQLPPGPLAVDLDEVDVIYPNGTTALTALSVHVPAGAVIGLVGRTGSGKSTIGRLLLRLLDATAGSVRIGSVDVRDVPLGQLRRRVAVVTQDVQLFHASLRDNLTLFGASIADDDHLVHVLHELGLGAWYESMPDGLDTVLGDDGAGSSAGEAQLVAFGRAFLRDPGVVILDEATSRLDPQTEARIEHAITKLLRGRTAILIAHRSSTLDRADEIVVLDRGRVVERGAEEQLTSNPRTCFAALPSTASAGALR